MLKKLVELHSATADGVPFELAICADEGDSGQLALYMVRLGENHAPPGLTMPAAYVALPLVNSAVSDAFLELATAVVRVLEKQKAGVHAFAAATDGKNPGLH